MSIADWEAMQNGEKAAATAPATPAKKRNKITRDETWDEPAPTPPPGKANKPKVIKPIEDEVEPIAADDEEYSEEAEEQDAEISAEDDVEASADEEGLWDEEGEESEIDGGYEAESA